MQYEHDTFLICHIHAKGTLNNQPNAKQRDKERKKMAERFQETNGYTKHTKNIDQKAEMLEPHKH